MKSRLFSDAKIKYIPISKLHCVGRLADTELTQNVMRFGILNPILVNELGGEFSVITGARRIDAAKKAGLKAVPCIILALQPFDADIISITDDTLSLPKSADSIRSKILRFQSLYSISDERIHHFAGRFSFKKAVSRRSLRASISDRRIFLNTVNRAADYMRLSGYEVAVSSTDDVREIKICLSQPQNLW